MLPGIRFLFAATVLSMSVLIFGLGAAALLRAAHQEFAHLPTRKPLPEPVFAQPAEPNPPVLALLRVEPAAVEEVPEEAVSPPADAPEQAEAEKLAALQLGDTAAADEQTEATASIGLQVSEPAKEDVPAPSTAESPSATTELAAVNDTASATPEPATPLASPQISEPAVRLATSGELALAIEPPPSAKPANAKPARKAIRKRAHAHRAKKQQRIAQPARRTAAVQQPADPFALPTIGWRSALGIRADQAGPVASGGPSGNPHSAHEPSYSAVPRTPRR